MILQRLEITRGTGYSWDKDQSLRGKISFKGKQGTVDLDLNEEMATKLLAIVADGIVEAASDIAHNLTAEVITQVTAIEHVK